MWTLPLDQIDKLNEFLEEKDIPIKGIPKEAFDAMKDPSEFNSIDITRIPSELFQTLLPFQKTGVLFSIKQQGKVLICDEMGLGKTIQAVAVSCYYMQDWPLLVIVPSFLKDQWSAEFKRWLPDLASDISIISTSKNWRVGRINIVSYDLINSLKDTLLKEQHFDAIICDESHYLKSADTQRTQAILPILKKSKRRILLTGTPALSRPSELYPQLDALDMPIFQKFEDFGLRYCKAFRGQHGWDYSGASNLLELHAILRGTVMIRRKKDDVLSELPEKNRSLVYIHPDEDIANDIQEKLGNINTKKSWEKDMEEDRTMSLLFQKTSKAKLDATEKYISNLLESEERKMLIFAYHIEMMDRIGQLLKEKDISFIRIDGSTPIKSRSDLTTQFSKKSHLRVAILSVTCASSGINMVAASLIVFAELYWTPGMLLQAEDRAHRIGQKASHIDIRYLIARKTLDDVMWPMIERKLKVVGETLNGQRESIEAVRVDGEDFRTIQSYSLEINESSEESEPITMNEDINESVSNTNTPTTRKTKKRSKSDTTKKSKRTKISPPTGSRSIATMFKEMNEKAKPSIEPVIIDLCDDDDDDEDIIIPKALFQSPTKPNTNSDLSEQSKDSISASKLKRRNNLDNNNVYNESEIESPLPDTKPKQSSIRADKIKQSKPKNSHKNRTPDNLQNGFSKVPMRSLEKKESCSSLKLIPKGISDDIVSDDYDDFEKKPISTLSPSSKFLNRPHTSDNSTHRQMKSKRKFNETWSKSSSKSNHSRTPSFPFKLEGLRKSRFTPLQITGGDEISTKKV